MEKSVDQNPEITEPEIMEQNLEITEQKPSKPETSEKSKKSKKNTKKGLYKEDEYKIFAPVKEKDASDLTIIVNGKTYKIQRGVEVTVPRAVYEVYKNMERMDTLAILRQRALMEANANNK